MKRAATHLFKRQSKNHAFFSELSNFYFGLRSPPRADPWARQSSENPTPGSPRMLRIARGRPCGSVWLGID